MVIERGRRREYLKDTSKWVTWPSVTTGVAQLPVAHAHTQGNPEGIKWHSVTSGSHGTTVLLLRKKRGKTGHAQNILPVGPFPDRWLYHFRIGYVTDVTSGHAQWSDPPQMRLCPCPYTTVLWQKAILFSHTLVVLSLKKALIARNHKPWGKNKIHDCAMTCTLTTIYVLTF